MTDSLSPRNEALPGEVAPVRLPDPARTFEVRAARFQALAPGHAIGPYLELLGSLAAAQALACRSMPVTLDGPELLSPVPLLANDWVRSSAWRHALDRIVGQVRQAPAPHETAESLSRLERMPAADLEDAATAVLERATAADPAVSAFVAAALEVYWTTLAALVPPGLFARDGGSRCPVCGSPPVAGIVLGDRPLRYLTCSLCAAEWYLPRLTCAHCGSTADLSYYLVDGTPPGIKAEACARCRHYLKLLYLEHLPAADPVADDVASVALDLLMGEEGFARAGVNPFLLPGREG
jgi:FdhE protein